MVFAFRVRVETMRRRYVILLVVSLLAGLIQLGSGTAPAVADRNKPYVPKPQKYEPVPHGTADTTWPRPRKAGKSRSLEQRGPLPKRWTVIQTASPNKASRFKRVVEDNGWTGAGLASLSGPASGSGKAMPLQGRYRLGLVDSEAASKVANSGIVFEVVAETGADTRAKFTLNYRDLAKLGGTDWASRLQLATLPACALTTPDKPACQRLTPLSDSANNPANLEVTATIDDLATGQVTADAPSGSSKAVEPDAGAADSSRSATSATLVAAVAGPGGSQGSYLASSLQSSGSWSHGGSSGSFSWNYPVAVTPAASGDAAPGVGLVYDSASIDGINSNSNPQSSWAGLGFDYQPGYIERTFRNCKETTPSSSDKGLCWAGDILTMHLPGGSTQALVVGDNGTIRPEHDNGEKIERLTGASNGSVNGEYWRVTTTDGKQYTFGLNVLPGGTTTNATKSAWNVPVYGGTTADGCAAKRCTRTWRWNLDMVEDVHHNVAAYYYAKETNYFVPSGTTTRTAYDRAGYLTRIDYGIKKANSSIYGVANPPNRVTFTVEERCNPTATITCTDAQFTAANKDRWPDVPMDQNCVATTTTACNINWPTFWTRKRLAKITTSYYSGTAYVSVDAYALKYVWSATSSTPALNIDTITRTATAGGQTLTLPPVRLGFEVLDSRVKGYKGLPDMGYGRLVAITSETGAATSITYSSQDGTNPDDYGGLCTATSVPAQDANGTTCYPVNWTQPFMTTPTLDYFHKYVVMTVIEGDSNGLTPARHTNYKYAVPGWHYDDNEVIKPAQRTWSQWRGFRSVETSTGNSSWRSDNGTYDQTTRSVATYYRGMAGDRLANGDARTGTEFKDSRDVERVDLEQFSGMVAETRTFNGSTELDSTRSIPDTLATTATRTRAPLPALKAYVVATQKTSESLAGTGTGTTDREVVTTTSFGGPSAEPFIKRPTSVRVVATGGVGDSAKTCTETTYADSTTNWVRSAPAKVITYSNPTDAAGGGCTGTALVAETRTYYDLKTAFGGANITIGDVTKVESAADIASGTVRYISSSSTYDADGRPKTSTVDPDGPAGPQAARVTSITYTPATGGPLAGVTTTVPAMTGITGSVTTTQTLDRARGVVTKSTDIAGRVTEANFDALGRYTAVWNPGRSKATQTASATYSYQASANLPLAVTSKTLVDPGNGATPGYDTTIQILDSRGVLRQTQSTSATGGRVISDTFVDSHGWVVATNDRWYTTGAPTTSVETVTQSNVDSRTTTIYDQAGRPTKTQSWRGVETTPTRTTTTVYGGDRTTVIPPAGAVATTTLVNGLGQTTELRRYTAPVTASTFATAASNKTTYGYNAAGQVNSMTTADGTDKEATWANTYDLLGRPTQTVDPDSGTSTTSYDDTGAVTSVTDAGGRTVSTKYDAWSRPVARFTGTTSTGTKIADWTYDTLAKGELTSSSSYVADAATGTVRTYTNTIVGYTPAGFPTGTDLTLSVPGLLPKYSTRATYTATGLPSSTTLAATRDTTLNQGSYAEELFHFYTSLGLERGLTGTNAYLSDAVYTPYREASQLVLGVNTGTSALTYTRDPHNRWITNTLLSGQIAPPQIENVAATYDAVGNLTRTVNTRGPAGSPTQTTCYRYDSLQQLIDAWTATDGCAADPTNATVGGPDPYWQTWKYDDAGSREKQTIHVLPGKSGSDAVTTYVNGVSGHAHAVASTETSGAVAPASIGVKTDLPATSSATYFADGATKDLTTPSGQTKYTYRSDGSLRTVTAADGSSSEFVNDADGERLLRIDRRSGTTDTTLYLPGQQVKLSETGANKTLTTNRYYALATGQQLAVRKNDTNPVWTLSDPNGTTQVMYDPLTDTTNPKVTRRAFDPYGNELSQDATATPWVDDRTFLNQPLDPITGLVDLGARQYDPATGRFTGVDPVLDLANPTQANGYNYANNNPIAYSDPTGAYPVCGGEQCPGAKPNQDGSGTWDMSDVTVPDSSSGSSSSGDNGASTHVPDLVHNQDEWEAWRNSLGDSAAADDIAYVRDRIERGLDVDITREALLNYHQNLPDKGALCINISWCAPLLNKEVQYTVLSMAAGEVAIAALIERKLAVGAAQLATANRIKSAAPGTFVRTEALSGRASAKNVRELAASMKANGWQGAPIDVVVLNGQRIVVDGHHRLAAARLAGIEVPYRTVDPSTVIGRGQWASVDDILQDTYNVGRDRLR
jgi:RHS repeat-associated protein